MTRLSLPAIAASALSLCFLLGAAPTASAQIACPIVPPVDPGPPPPPVDVNHIFCGAINAAGNAVGFHSRPGGLNPVTVAGVGAPVPTGPAGIYRLNNFQILGQPKLFSTMFPDACGQAAVVAAIRNAGAAGLPGQQFNGVSGPTCQAGVPPANFNIRGYKDAAGTITTAYPNY